MDTLLQAHATPPAAGAQGLLPRVLARLLFKRAQVAGRRDLGGGLHLVTLEGEALRGADWSPGDKLQLRLGTGLATRTYTPIGWHADTGHVAFIAHALAWGPGSEWVRRAQAGQAVDVFGPRASLDLRALDRADSVLAGDETALGLAVGWRPAHTVLEVTDTDHARRLFDTLDLPATAVPRAAADQHLPAMARALLQAAGPTTRFVLAGRAATVQALQRALRAEGVARQRMVTKAYWAEGKTGLD